MTKNELLKKIEEAQASGAERLNLSNEGLETLPPEIGELRRLTFINVRKNQLSKLPGGLFQIKSLLRGIFDGNPLVFPPPSIVKQGISATRRHIAAQEQGRMLGGGMMRSSVAAGKPGPSKKRH